MNDTNTTSRNVPRSIGAVLAGFFAVFVLSLVTDQLFHVLEVFPPWGQPTTDTGPLLLALAYRIVYGIAGGIAMWDLGAHWYPVALALTALPCAWIGALLFANRDKR